MYGGSHMSMLIRDFHFQHMVCVYYSICMKLTVTVTVVSALLYVLYYVCR